MKALSMTAAGGPEVLQLADVAEPALSADTDIKIRVCAAGVNPVDTKIRARGLFYGARPPAILGCDGAGEVVAVGRAVTRFQVGDAVWYCHGGLGREPGSYAEFRVMPEHEAEFRPIGLNFAEAAAAPLVLLTAWEALYDRAGLQPGQQVLIHGGAGGVGHVAIQLAKLHGADVMTTVSSPEKAAFCKELGADAWVDYRQQDVAAAVRDWTDGRGVDVVLETVGGQVFRDSIALLAPYGALVTLLEPGPDWDIKTARLNNLRICFTLMLTPMLLDLREAREHQGEILRRCGEWMSEGRLRVHIDRTLPLHAGAEAHRQLEAGHTQGKVVLLT